MKCRHCSSNLELRFVDLGSAPPSNSYLTEEGLARPEKWYPLRVLVCESCWLVQTEFSPADELFDPEYAYFSSYSTSWVEHAERYVAAMVERFDLDAKSHVVEIAANDGYLLQHALSRGIPCTGVEPTASTAAAARKRNIPVVEEFFGATLAKRMAAEGKQADLMPANNVLAHVPDINDFVAGFAALLKPNGVATFEFPHLLRLVEGTQFDTIYHEHFSYFSLTAVTAILDRGGLSIFDVEEISTHGGSLRVFAQLRASGGHPVTDRVRAMLDAELRAGVTTPAYYADFQLRTDRVKDAFVSFLIEAKKQGKTVCGYGAAAKGNTLMNYAGVRPDLLGFVVDRNPAKRGKYMPGSRIPIVDESHLRVARPDYIVLLPWNLKSELTKQLSYVSEWQGELVTAIS